MASDKKIRVGLLGAGGITGAHLNGFNACSDRAEVVAIADPRREAAEARSRQFGGAEIYESWETLIEEADVDAIDICLPHHLHHPAAMAAFAKGLHVLTEKPVARNLQEADEMIETAATKGLVFMVCHNRRWIHSVQKLKEVVDSGEIGRLLAIRLEKNGGPGFHRPASLDWVAKKETLGGGAMVSDLIHEMDLLNWLGGPVASVSGVSVTVPDWMEGEVLGVITLMYRSGAIGDGAINWAARGVEQHPVMPGSSIRVIGTDGIAIYSLTKGLHVIKGFESQFTEVCPPDTQSGHERAIPHFIDSIIEGTEPLTSGPVGRAALELAMACYQSQAEGRTVPLPLAPPYFASAM